MTTIIPVFNRPQLLREVVQSVIAQTYRPIEVIIVDDGSTDETESVAQELEREYVGIVRTLRRENSGPAVARNDGERAARGEFIQYLDSDDLLEPTKFERQVAALRAHSEAGVCYGITMRRDGRTGEMQPWARTAETIENVFPEFLMQRGWDTNSPLWRRSVCEQIGPWAELRVMEDWEHDLRAGLLGVKAVHVAEHVATVRDHDEHRASGMNTGFTPEITRDFFLAHKSIWQKMKEAGRTDWSYLETFSRKLFWIARMCGERGLIEEANEALAFAEEMAATHHNPRETRVFRRLTKLFGWRATVAMTEGVKYWTRREDEQPAV